MPDPNTTPSLDDVIHDLRMMTEDSKDECDAGLVKHAADEIERLRAGLQIIASTADVDADMSAVIARRYLEGGKWGE